MSTILLNNLRGPAGYNATGAAEDDAAIAAFIRSLVGTTATRDQLDSLYNPRIEQAVTGSTKSYGSSEAFTLWRNLIVNAKTLPVRIVTLGSSTPAVGKFQVKLLEMLAAAYPLSGGMHDPVIRPLADATVANTSSPGFHFINGAVGGTAAGNFLTTEQLDQLTALTPQIVITMVGSNDDSGGTTPYDYGRSVAARLRSIDGRRINTQVLHVLVHAHQRQDDSATSSLWASYGAELMGVAANSPSNTIVIDTSGAFYSLGVGRGLSDQYKLMMPDKIHLTDLGHEVMGASIYYGLSEAGAPIPGRQLGFSMSPITGSTFAVNGTLVGKSTDAFAGGTAMAWQGATSDFNVVSGGLTVVESPASSTFVGVPQPAYDFAVSFSVVFKPTAAGGLPVAYFDWDRTALGETGSLYRVAVSTNGVRLFYKPATGTSIALTSWVPLVSDAQRITAGRYRHWVFVMVNGAVVDVVDTRLYTAVTRGGYVGVGASQGATESTFGRFDNVVFSILT